MPYNDDEEGGTSSANGGRDTALGGAISNIGNDIG
jgi:hypothetical protein